MTTKTYRTVGEYIECLKQFPPDWRVEVATQAGGGIAIEHREINGEPVVAVFGANGGRFGENPLTEDEYQEKSTSFLRDINTPGMAYTSAHGDHRTYYPGHGSQASCYGQHYDRRIIERIVDEGKIDAKLVDIDRVKRLSR